MLNFHACICRYASASGDFWTILQPVVSNYYMTLQHLTSLLSPGIQHYVSVTVSPNSVSKVRKNCVHLQEFHKNLCKNNIFRFRKFAVSVHPFKWNRVPSFPFPLLLGLELRPLGSEGNSPASPLGPPGLLTIRLVHSPLYHDARHQNGNGITVW